MSMFDLGVTTMSMVMAVPLDDNVYRCPFRTDDKKYFYTATGKFVTEVDIQDWLSKYNRTLESIYDSPVDNDGVSTLEGLRDALIFYKLPLGEAANAQDLLIEWEAVVTKRLNDFALEKQYASISVACSYNTSNVPEWSADAEIAIKLRDDTWFKANELAPQIAGGTITISDALEQLPVLSWGVQARSPLRSNIRI